MSQIFKKNIDSEIIISFLKEFCQNEKKNEYIFSPISFKKAEYNNKILNLIENLNKKYQRLKSWMTRIFILLKKKFFMHIINHLIS